MALPSNFNTLQDVIYKLGQPGNSDTGFQAFQKADHVSDLQVLGALQKCNAFSLPALKGMIDAQTHNAAQPVEVRVLGNMGGATTSLLTQGGTGSFNSFDELVVPVATGNVIAYKFVISATDMQLLDAYSTDPDVKFRMLLEHGMRQGVEKILEDINKEAINFLDGIKAPGGGRGILPNDGADNNEIDLQTDLNPYLTLYEEILANRFGSSNKKLAPKDPTNDVSKPLLVGTPGLWTNEQSLMQFGGNNERNAAPQVKIVDFVPTNSMSVVNPLTDRGFGYLIDKRAVAIGSREGQWIKENWRARHLSYESFQVSAMYPDLNLPDITMVAYISDEQDSTFATYGNPESYLDQIVKVTLYTFPYFVSAPVTTLDRTGVIAYRFLA